MKPLLPSPWTAEDEGIAFRHGRGRWATTLRAGGLQADIRDAELMLRLTQTRALSPPNARAVCHSLLSFGFEPSDWP